MARNCLYLVILLFTAAGLAGCEPTGPGRLLYTGPVEQTVARGESIPGSNIHYLGYSDAGAQVLINDQHAIKIVGDSLDWKGAPVPGVDVVMALRVLAANSQRLHAVGTVRVTVQDAQPELATFPDRPAFTYKVAVSYTVRQGERIPGTLITYGGKSEEGAEFSGISGYPYRRLGDSVAWSGRLRSNTYLDMTLRVIAYGDGFVTLGGLADLGLTR